VIAMRVEEIDAQTAPDDTLRDLYLVETEAGGGSLGVAPAPTYEQRVARYRNPGIATRHYWTAREEDEIAGFAALHSLGATLVTADVLVRPRFRRRGVGTRLFASLCSGARAAGVASFFGHYADDAGAAFARHVGARDDQREVKSVLRLRDVRLPEPALPAGIALRSWVGHIPEELAESFVRARNAMIDAPAPGTQAMVPWTVEQTVADNEAQIARGAPVHFTVAVEDGEVVALTGVRVGPAPCPYAATDDTATIPSARGRGLAYAVKLENLRRLHAERPDVELVGTMNAEHNVAMRAINTKLGFVPTVTLTTAVVTLSA
jgi:GNAT superfamily N-acetyltransferase